MDPNAAKKMQNSTQTTEFQTGDSARVPILYPPPYGIPIPVASPGLPPPHYYVPPPCPWTYFPDYVFPPPGSAIAIPPQDRSQYQLVKAHSFYNPIFNEIQKISKSNANSLSEIPDKLDAPNHYRLAVVPERDNRSRQLASGVPSVGQIQAASSNLPNPNSMSFIFKPRDPSRSPFGQRLLHLADQIRQFQLNPELLARTVLKEGNQKFLRRCVKTMKRAKSVPLEVTEMVLVMLIQRLLKGSQSEAGGIDSDSGADSEDEDNLDEYILHGWLTQDYTAKFLTEIDNARQMKLPINSTTASNGYGLRSAISSVCDFFARKSGLETECNEGAASSSRQGKSQKYSELFRESPSKTSKNGDGVDGGGDDSFTRKHKKYMDLLRLAGIHPLPPYLMAPLNVRKSSGKLSLAASTSKHRPSDTSEDSRVRATKDFSSHPGLIEGNTTSPLGGSTLKGKGAKPGQDVTRSEPGLEVLFHPKKATDKNKSPRCPK